MGGPTALLKQLLLTLVISSCKIADHSELISYTLATGLWKLLIHYKNWNDIQSCSYLHVVIDRDHSTALQLTTFILDLAPVTVSEATNK